MQPSIALGTILQNRYRMLSVLGQGGFGRTYLAEDQGRFNERCALKEFIPPQGSAYALAKAKELFQREATILYQIQHPQIPQFRATFEENQRLFLVQDYVDGKTFRTLLNDRKSKGLKFSETEVLQLIQQILPVLHHIHSKGIIHRDIAPDNIILRQPDNLPVLIDFGVVKEIATKVQSPETNAEPTTVGKLGYAPSEQMQTGRAYPSSDLYSLAVTALVLLTGREPQDLYDDRTLTWTWQRWVQLSPAVGQVLDRMLSYRPGDRYQSAGEVAQALQGATGGTVAPAAPAPDVSQMQTMAVGRPAPAPARAPERRSTPAISTRSSGWENPLAIILTAMGVAVVTGIASWAIVSALRNANQVAPSPTPTPSVSVSPSPSVSPAPSPTLTPSPVQPTEYSQRLEGILLPNGETKTFQGNLRSNETIAYVIPAQQGQTLNASLEGEGVLLTVLAPNRDSIADRVPSWQDTLAFTGDYTVRLSPVKGLPESDFRLNLNLQAAPAPSPLPSPIDTPPPEPQIEAGRLDLPLGRPVEFSDRASDTVIKRYLVEVQPGQVLSAQVLDGNALLNVRSTNGEIVDGGQGVDNWSGRIFDPGTYQIDVIASQPTNFSLRMLLDDRAR